MADTPETKAKKRIRKTIERVAAARGMRIKVRSNAAGGVGFTNGTPDLTLYVCMHDGHAVTVDVEVKAGRGKPSALQTIELTASSAHGVHALVVWGDWESDMQHFERFLMNLTHETPPLLKLVRIADEWGAA